MIRRLAPIAVACLLVAAAGCGDDGPGDAASTTTTGAPSPAPTASTSTTRAGGSGSTTTTARPPFAGGTAPVVLPAAPSGTTHLVDVRVAGHDGYDRVVLEFDEALPAVEVRYAQGPISASGSGEAVPVEGGAVLTVRLEPASGVDLSGPTFVETYRGPARVRAGDTSTVTEVVRTGDFEGVLEWAIGVGSSSPFRVDTVAAPPRVVIDVAAP